MLLARRQIQGILQTQPRYIKQFPGALCFAVLLLKPNWRLHVSYVTEAALRNPVHTFFRLGPAAGIRRVHIHALFKEEIWWNWESWICCLNWSLPVCFGNVGAFFIPTWIGNWPLLTGLLLLCALLAHISADGCSFFARLPQMLANI